MKKILFIMLLLTSAVYCQIPTPAKDYTPFLRLKLYQSGARNIADSLNWNYSEIDTAIRAALSGVNAHVDSIARHRDVLNRYSTDITQNASQIELQATQINELMGTVTEEQSNIQTLQSTVSIQAGQIQARVEKTDYNGSKIKSLVNVDTSGVQLEGKHIKITGETTFSSGYDPSLKVNVGGSAADINGNTTKINGGKISTNTLSAICANLGTVTAGELSGVTIHTANNYFVIDSSGAVASFQTMPTSDKWLTLNGGQMGFRENGSPFTLWLSRDSNGGLDVNGDISSNGTKVSLEGHIHSCTTQTITYLDNNADPHTITVVTAVGGTN